MAEIRLITEGDIKDLKYTNMRWDVVINGVPFHVLLRILIAA